MTAVGLGLAAVGVVLIFAGVKGTDPRDMLLQAFEGQSPASSAFSNVGDRASQIFRQVTR